MSTLTAALRILLVDDEAGIRTTLAPILEKAGFEVRTAESVPDALFEINSNQFSAVITDLNIGEEGDGFLVTSAMRHVQPNCLTFILTGYPAFETAMQAIHNEVDDYLVKPVEVEALIGAVKHKLEGQKQKTIFGTKRLVEVLAENKTHIAEQITESLKRDYKTSRTPAEEIGAHLASFLDAVLDRVKMGREVSPQSLSRSVAEYSQVRTKGGHGVAHILRDFRVLEQAIYGVVQRNLTSMELVNLIPDLRQVTSSLNLLQEQSIGALPPPAAARN